jgi:predicted esterase
MLQLKYAEENQHILEQLGMEVTLATDKVAHTISTKQLYDFVDWLQGVIC